jgi:hypothetical protein
MINQLFKVEISLAPSGNINSSKVLAFDSIFLITSETFHILKKLFILKDVQSNHVKLKFKSFLDKNSLIRSFCSHINSKRI